MGIIKTVGLKKTFFNDTLEQVVLKGIDIDINEGDFAGIVGPSGSGKTTLLYCLSSLESITDGSVYVLDKDIAKYTERDISKLRQTEIGFVFQFYNLVPNLTVYENVLLARIIADKDESYVDDVLAMVSMKEFKNYYPNQLSGGMQQRVAIARALVNQPKIIFADEPTGNLDQKIGKEIMDLLAKLNRQEHVTIVLVTHNEDYLSYCNRVFRLLDGKIV
ncbi:MAG TPA: ABC transporter ATP-binding protein [Bacillota bacterium]|mgnify:CR=1 FL=1|nr:ABC transporter ATP-binding protein [Bacillota bacterium]